MAEPIEAAVAGTPFTADLIAAIAYQETGYLWAPLVARGLSAAELLKVCVGDTIDAFSTEKMAAELGENTADRKAAAAKADKAAAEKAAAETAATV